MQGMQIDAVAEDENSPPEARQAYRRRLRAALPDVFEMTDDVSRVAAQVDLGSWSDSERTVAGTGLYRKLQHDAQAAFLLLENGLVSQAQVMMRVVFDTLVILKLCRWCENYHTEHENQQQVFRRYALKKSVGNPRRFGVAKGGVPKIQAERREIKKDIQSKSIETPKTHELVSRADAAEREALEGDGASLVSLQPIYETASQLSNLHAHSNVKAVEPYLISLQKGHGHEVRLFGVRLVGVNVAAMVLIAAGLLRGIVAGARKPRGFDDVWVRQRALLAELESEDRPS